ncbi:hypothetical protein ACAG96_07640 [Candidatus Izemoplasma sp. B36]|uniref:hypothetical protein n=1 Tax=Candidatus Izemoplasma sp. B36 TaxID=3242468 RepID=UPI003557AB96
MNKIKTIEVSKSDYNDIEQYLKKNDLLDNKNLWFAGFDDRTRGMQNAVAENLFYGNKRLDIISVKEDIIYVLLHAKKSFNVYEFDHLSNKIKIKVHRNLIFPSVEMYNENGDLVQLQAKKNKNKVFDLKKLIKEKR